MITDPCEKEMACALAGAGQLPRKLTEALGVVGRRFQACSGTLHALGEDGLLHLAAAFGIPEQLRPVVQCIAVGKGIAGAAAAQRRPVTICNLQTDDGGGVAKPGARATGVEGALAVPILDGEELVGVLGVGKLKPYEYSEQEKELLIRLGRMVIPELRGLL